jgi:hypothetical protein
MATKKPAPVTSVWSAPLANKWVGWGVIAAAALALFLSFGKTCTCKGKPCCAKPPHARGK